MLCSFDFFSKKCIIKHRGMDFLETFNGLRFLSFISLIPPPPPFFSLLFCFNFEVSIIIYDYKWLSKSYIVISHHDTLVIILLTTWYMYTAIYFNFFFNPFICLSTRQISLLDGQYYSPFQMCLC